MKIPINEIVIGERQRAFVPDASFNQLVNSFIEIGQINPITIKLNAKGEWELVAGRHRLEAARSLGWLLIDASDAGTIDETMHQKIEFEEDVRRKDRTWQEKCLAVSKLYTLLSVEKGIAGEDWTYKSMESFVGIKHTSIKYMMQVATALKFIPRDEQIWACDNYWQALELLRSRAEKEAQREMERRRSINQVKIQTIPTTNQRFETELNLSLVKVDGFEISSSQVLTQTEPLTLAQRVFKYNMSYTHLWNQQLILSFDPDKPTDQFITGYWWLGGGNISDFYGAYQVEYLKRIGIMFDDIKGKQNVVHLFSGSIPPSQDYSVVGLADAGCKPDLEINAEQLSSFLPFKPKLIFADPPYSKEDSEHYVHAMVNRAKVIEECGIVLQSGGFLVWLDQALPVFSNEQFRLCGVISYIRNTANRFRCVVIFQKR